MSDPSGGEVKSDVVQAFDVMQRATLSQKNIGANSVTMASSYDSAGRVYTLTYFPGQGNQRVFRYNYDGAGNLTSLHDDSGGRDLVQYTDFTALGQFKKATFPKLGNQSVVTDYTYNATTGRLATLLTSKYVSGTPTAVYQNLAYQQYSGKGQLEILADYQNGIAHTCQRDNLDRLVSAVGTGSNPYSQTYQYDRIGNIAYKSDVGSYSYYYSNKPHAVRTAGSIYRNRGELRDGAAPLKKGFCAGYTHLLCGFDDHSHIRMGI